MVTLTLTLPANSLLRSRLRAGKRPSTVACMSMTLALHPTQLNRRRVCARSPASGYAQWPMGNDPSLRPDLFHPLKPPLPPPRASKRPGATARACGGGSLQRPQVLSWLQSAKNAGQYFPRLPPVGRLSVAPCSLRPIKYAADSLVGRMLQQRKLPTWALRHCWCPTSCRPWQLPALVPGKPADGALQFRTISMPLRDGLATQRRQ